MVDQRRHHRRALTVEFSAREANGSGELTFTSADVSLGGAFLKSDLLLEEGERLVVRFRLPGQSAPVQAGAAVAWLRRFPGPDEPAGMGVRFEGMTAEHVALLNASLALDGD